MAKCRNDRHNWQSNAVFIGKQCVMLMRCKRKSCREFGGSPCLAPEPFPGSINASLLEVPKDFRELLENLVAKIEAYPSYDL